MKIARTIDYKVVRAIERAKRIAYHPPEIEEVRGPDNCNNWFIANDEVFCLCRIHCKTPCN